MLKSKVVVVGGNHSGISVATHLSKDPNLEILILEADDNISYVGAEGLLWVQGVLPNQAATGYTTPEKLESKGIKVLLKHPVVKLDFGAKNKVIAQDLETNQAVEFEFDYLVLATGSSPRTPEFKNTRNIPTQTMKNLHDGIKLKQMSEDKSIKKVAIIGGGDIGVETAQVLQNCGKDVTIYQGGSAILKNAYDSDFIEDGVEELEKHGVKIVYGPRIESLDEIEADYFILALGFLPNSELGGELLIREPKSQSYLVNDHQQTNLENIYAIGDCASTENLITGTSYTALGSNTATTALVCAHHILNMEIIKNFSEANSPDPLKEAEVELHFDHNLGSSNANAIKIYDLIFTSLGITEAEAIDLKIPYQAFSFTDELKQTEISENNSLVTIKILVHSENHQLLGVQIKSKTDVSQIMHLFALAIQEHLTVERIKYLDMFFNPELNKLYNFVTRCLSKF